MIKAFKFNNGLFISKCDFMCQDTSCYCGNTTSKILHNNKSYNIANVDAFIPNVNTNKLTFAKTSTVPTVYKAKDLKDVTPDVYEKLTDFYKSQYEAEKEEVEVLQEIDVVILASFDCDYNPEDKNSLKYEMKLNNPLSGVIPDSLLHYCFAEIDAESLVRIVDKIKFNYTKGVDRLINCWPSLGQMTVSLYTKPFTGDKKQLEVKKANGQSYATKRYKEVVDKPTIAERFEIENFNLKAKNAMELEKKIDEFIHQLLYKEII